MKEKLFDVVLLAGGLATRLRPLTETLPKSLVPINGEPFIAHQLRLLKKQGIQHVIICTGYLGEMVKDFVKDGTKFQLSVSYSSDGDQLLGTAGAIKRAYAQLPDTFFVLYGDSYLPCDYAAVQSTFCHSQKDALMTVFCNKGNWDKSNIEFNEGKIISYDKKKQAGKMQHIDYGLGVFHKRIFTALPGHRFYDLADLYQTLLMRQQLAAHEVKSRFYEIGSFSGITELESYLLCNS